MNQSRDSSCCLAASTISNKAQPLPCPTESVSFFTLGIYPVAYRYIPITNGILTFMAFKKKNFVAQLSDIKAVRAVAARVGCVLSGSSLDGEGSIRQMLEQLGDGSLLALHHSYKLDGGNRKILSDARRLQKIADAIEDPELKDLIEQLANALSSIPTK